MSLYEIMGQEEGEREQKRFNLKRLKEWKQSRGGATSLCVILAQLSKKFLCR